MQDDTHENCKGVHLLDLPVELIHLIIRELSYCEILNLECTCLALAQATDSFRRIHKDEWAEILEEYYAQSYKDYRDDGCDRDDESYGSYGSYGDHRGSHIADGIWTFDSYNPYIE